MKLLQLKSLRYTEVFWVLPFNFGDNDSSVFLPNLFLLWLQPSVLKPSKKSGLYFFSAQCWYISECLPFPEWCITLADNMHPVFPV